MKSYPKELRERVVAAIEEGFHTIAEVAEMFGVGITFVKKMLNCHRTGESLDPRHGGGANPLLNEEQLKMLRAAVETRPDATLEELQWFLLKECKVKASSPTICRALQKLNLPRKKKSLASSERDKKKRKAFRKKVAELDVSKFIFIDEMGSHVALTRLYGRAAPGARVVEEVPGARGENVSTIGAMALNGVRAAMSVPGAIDGETLTFFVEQVLAPVLNPDEIVFMDNCPTHKVADVKEAIESAGAKLEFLPTYSPDFNPIENCWSKIKSMLRTLKPRTIKELMDALRKAFASITEQDILGWFIHCGYQAAST
jgi:transposase